MNKKQRMYQAIEKHGNDLNAIFKTDLAAVDLCKKLRRLELQATRLTEDQCNTGADHEEKLSSILVKVKGLLLPATPTEDYKLYDAIFINGDPRGYALKIDDDYMRELDLVLHKDWGGYGILAPDFNYTV